MLIVILIFSKLNWYKIILLISFRVNWFLGTFS